MRLVDAASTGPVALLDGSVLRDMATALSGLWLPVTELDHRRTADLVAAARLRLYATRDRAGWYLVTTQAAATVTLRRGRADWSVGMLPVAEEFEDAPPAAEVEALVEHYRHEQRLTSDAARTLATALLFEPVRLVVSRDPRAYRHARAGDLPARLEVVDARDAVDRLAIAPGERPGVPLPAGSMLERGAAWWLVA